jgi:hypothetical protein
MVGSPPSRSPWPGAGSGCRLAPAGALADQVGERALTLAGILLMAAGLG